MPVAIYTQREAHERKSRQDLARRARAAEDYACIGEIPAPVDLARRKAALEDFRVFCRTYHEPKFYLPDSDAHGKLDDALIEAVTSSKLSDYRAFAFPRGSGKTTRSLLAIEWAMLKGLKRYALMIGSNDSKASQLLSSIWSDLTTNRLLGEDFPEVCRPLTALENNKLRTRRQTYRTKDGETRQTGIEWSTNHVRFPSIEGSDSAGSIFATFGITSKGIRGSMRLDESTGEVRRPDVVILDDIQNDESAMSASQCAKLIKIVESSVKYLRGPQKPISIMMPCTVLFEHDVADQYTDLKTKPVWRGIRISMLKSMPTNLKEWAKYFAFRDQLYDSEKSLTEVSEALNAYYRLHRKVLDKGAEAFWPENFDSGEESAVQHAMHLYRDDEESFWAECQNRPKSRLAAMAPLEREDLLRKRLPGVERGQVTSDVKWVVSFIDIHNEIFYWLTLGVSENFNGNVVNFGTWPHYDLKYVHKAEASRLRGLSRAYWEEHGGRKAQKAPFEAKMYYSLSECVKWLLSREYRVAGEDRTLQHSRIGIDIRWGLATETSKRYLRELRDDRVTGCFGQYVGATTKSFSEYQRSKGWLFEHHKHKHLTESSWIWRYDDTGLYYLLLDSNMLKSFAVNRLSSPPGAPGSIGLFKEHPSTFEMLVDHFCNSETPFPVAAKGRTVDEWKPRPDGADNDLLDCLAGCMALGSFCGASLQTGGPPRPTRRLTLQQIKDAQRKSR